jgi:hypothetical protein
VAPGQPPVEAEKEATPEEFGNKFGNISEEEQEEASQVVDIMARPERDLNPQPSDPKKHAIGFTQCYETT